MKIRRLGWAGIEVLSADGPSLVVDFVQDFFLLSATRPPGAFVEPIQPAAAALVTHLHEDHTDVIAIQSAVGSTGLVLRPEPFTAADEEAAFTEVAEADLLASGLNVRVVADWERIQLPPFTITAAPSVDGLGDRQVNWVIEADGKRVFHGGDTIFHGYWWLIARRAGPIDVAVLPINGAVVNVPHLQPASPLPAVLTPEQAAQAAAILGAKTVVPIHFGVHQPPVYVEESNAVDRLVEAAAGLAIHVAPLAPGDGIDVA
ncbi:MBL fold metallo-hydrolase [Mycolicibacterium mengxianglii]|uniref:MBL fold metallo-hydrolase n=1 Tax=Mycolicibacterium mengxianglii TaxID=2736649 RepID=UPI0018D0A691|nr:MBL fold metallo-hydrolase [Mycolicibacterium mengxianglii]